jgi:hypothetical protein
MAAEYIEIAVKDWKIQFKYYCRISDHLCGLVVRILATDPEVRVRFSLYQIF